MIRKGAILCRLFGSLLSIVFLDGCGQAAPRTTLFQTQTLISLRQVVTLLANETIKREQLHFGEPVSIDYCVTIDPCFCSTMFITGLGGDRLWDGKVSGNIMVVGNTKTLDKARIASVVEAVEGSDGGLRTDIYIYIWRDRRWIAAQDCYLQQLSKVNPELSKELQADVERINQMVERRMPTSRPK